MDVMVAGGRAAAVEPTSLSGSAFMHEYIYVKNDGICDWLRLHCVIDLCAEQPTDKPSAEKIVYASIQ